MAERSYVWLGVALLTGVGLAVVIAMSGAFVRGSEPLPELLPTPSPRGTPPPARTAPAASSGRSAPAAMAPATEGEQLPATVSCKIDLPDPSISPPDAEILYREPDLDDEAGLPGFIADIRDGTLSFDPPEGITEGMLRAEGFLEVKVRWIGDRCTKVRLRPSATVAGRVDPAWGSPHVIGCGTSAPVGSDGTFEVAIPPGMCAMRAVRDEDGVIVDSDPVPIQAEVGERVEIVLLLPED